MKKLFAFLGVALLTLILPLFFIKKVNAADIASLKYDTLSNVDYAWSILCSVPVLDENASIYLFYIQDENLTPYYFSVRRSSNTNSNGLVSFHYFLDIYYTDLLKYSYEFDEDLTSFILVNMQFTESGLDSSISFNYSISYLQTIGDFQRPLIKLESLITQNYIDRDFTGRVTYIQCYFRSRLCKLAKLNDFAPPNDPIYSNNGLLSSISFWENNLLSSLNIEKSGYSVGYSAGYSKGQSDALNTPEGVNRFWDLFLKVFSGVGSILSIQLFPGVTIGLFILLPLAFAIVGLILWLWKR